MTSRTVLMDAIFGILALLVLVVLSLLPHIGQSEAEKAEPVIFRAVWPQDRDVDVDLWVLLPTDRSVGYLRRDAAPCGLVWDDQGSTVGANLMANDEQVVCRDRVPGVWWVNLVGYAFRDRGEAVPVLVQVFHKGRLVARVEAEVGPEEEVTVLRIEGDTAEPMPGFVPVFRRGR